MAKARKSSAGDAAVASKSQLYIVIGVIGLVALGLLGLAFFLGTRAGGEGPVGSVQKVTSEPTLSQPSAASAGSAADATPDGSQLVMVGLNRGTYSFSPSTVKAGVPVTLRSDGSVRGCGLSMQSKGLGFSGSLSSGGITFTPRQKGTFDVSCGMGMYWGKLTVE